MCHQTTLHSSVHFPLFCKRPLKTLKNLRKFVYLNKNSCSKDIHKSLKTVMNLQRNSGIFKDIPIFKEIQNHKILEPAQLQ